jgi:hypothetical protein
MFMTVPITYSLKSILVQRRAPTLGRMSTRKITYTVVSLESNHHLISIINNTLRRVGLRKSTLLKRSASSKEFGLSKSLLTVSNISTLEPICPTSLLMNLTLLNRTGRLDETYKCFDRAKCKNRRFKRRE